MVPEGFKMGPINRAEYKRWRYVWNFPCAHLNEVGGWYRVSFIPDDAPTGGATP